MFQNNDAGLAADDFGGADDALVIGNVERQNSTKASPESSPPSVVETLNATLELQLGLNLLRIDPTDPRDLAVGPYVPDAGWHAFSITFGPEVRGLQGTVVGVCSVTRSLSTNQVRPGDRVDVTLSARNISGTTTITETFPAGWAVASAGGGTVNAANNTITFRPASDVEISYTLSAPADSCLDVDSTLTGTVAGPGICVEEVRGNWAGVPIEGKAEWLFLPDERISVKLSAGRPSEADSVNRRAESIRGASGSPRN